MSILRLQKDVAGIETFVHVHHGDSGLAIAGGDRCLDRRGAAPARQKRCVQIQAGESWNLEHARGKICP